MSITASTERQIRACFDKPAGDEMIAALNGVTAIAGDVDDDLFAIGGAVPTNPQSTLAINPGARATGVTADQSFHQMQIAPTGAVTIPTGTAPLVTSLNVNEPNITATGTVTAAATVRIADAPTEGSANYALWVDAGVTRLDGNVNVAAAAWDLIGIANTAAAIEVTDGTAAIIAVDTRNTIADVNVTTFAAPATTIATAAAAHQNPTVKIAARTIIYTGTNTVTSQLGAQLNIGALTLTDASAGTVSLASSVHISAVAAAGGSLTLTAARMISTSVADAYLTNAGVWTDTACWESGKKFVTRNFERAEAAIESVIDKIIPATWRYRKHLELPGIDQQGNPTIHRTAIDDRNRNRAGIIYDDLPDELRAPGEEHGVAPSILASFALAAIRVLRDRNAALEARITALEAR